MTTMRCARVSVICAGVLVLSAAAASGCSRVVDGAPSAAMTGPLPQLLIDPGRFPPRYPPVVLGPEAAGRALQVIDGVPDGSKVSPQRCAPPPPREVAAIVGEDGERSLIVALSRTDTSLRERRDQLSGCPMFTVDNDGMTSTVRVAVLSSPPVAADDSCAWAQTVSGTAQHTTLTLVAQLGDVRVTTSVATIPGAFADTEALDGLFSDAVLTARHGSRI
jgi:hypothetical protein